MASIVWPDVVSIAKELAGDRVSLAGQTWILRHVNKRLNVALFGGEDSDDLRMARLFLAAHMGTKTSVGDGGAIIAESGGGLSVQYAPPIMTRSALFETAYGRQYWDMLRVAAGGPWVF